MPRLREQPLQNAVGAYRRRKPRLHAETAARLTRTTALPAPITGRRYYIRRKKIGRFSSSDFSIAIIIGSHSEQPIIRPLQSSFSDTGNKRLSSVEREQIAVLNEDMDESPIDRDVGNIGETNLSIVMEHPVIGILRYDDFLVVDRQTIHVYQRLQLLRHEAVIIRSVLSSLCHMRLFYGGCKNHTKRRESTLNTGIEVQPSTYPLDR